MVMLDVEMPGLSGHDVCVRLREAAGDLLPIVMVTGMDDLQSVDRAYHAGATDFIAKPINWALFGHRVKYLLRGNQILLDLQTAEQKIRRMAYFDPLTDLPNRQSFLERVDREIARARASHTRLGVLFIDLDGFKIVNDTMGHGVGDLCLRLASERLRLALRPSDAVSRPIAPDADNTLARLGGDEFTALLLGVAEPNDAWIVANRLREQMRDPFLLNGLELRLSSSIGIALYPDDGLDALALLEHADTAMYHAKDQGRNNCQFYDAALTQQALLRLNLANSLHHALERGEFRLVYQPQFDLDPGRITSVEALLRWEHPERGLISPMDFIPLAEVNGLIVPIGAWVLRAACMDAARWRQAGTPVRVSVNLSPMQLRDPELLQTILDILVDTGVPPHYLELEVTETMVMEIGGAATLRALREAGVRIALDDFGTGYSSMSYLTRMPLDILKIDKSFIMALPGDKRDRAIVRAILSLAKSLGFRVTAEGVETLVQAQMLKSMACDTLQGYLFSKPIGADQVPALRDKIFSLEPPAPSRVA
jgi:diguanylate cyclase (GGDEF)-like protein